MQNLPVPVSPVNGLSEAERRRLDRLAERETVIQYDDAGGSARVFTCHRGLAASILRRGVRPIRENRRNGRVDSGSFEEPKSWIAVRPPKRSGMTVEQRRAAAERLALLKKPDQRSSDPKELASVEG